MKQQEVVRICGTIKVKAKHLLEMDEVMSRFPYLMERILQIVDDKGLVKSREVSRRLQGFIGRREYPWLRIVKIPTRLKTGDTYLHLAAEYGQLDMFVWILEIESKSSLRETDKNLLYENSSSSFLVACRFGRVEIAKMLLKKLHELKIDFMKEANAISWPHQNSISGDEPESLRFDPLLKIMYVEQGFQLACRAGHINIVEMMIVNSESLKFDLTVKTIFGHTGFHLACGAGHVNVVEMLIDKSKFINLDLNAKDIQGYTGFQLAVNYWIVDVINCIQSKMPCLAHFNK